MIKEPKNILYYLISIFLFFAILFGIYLMLLLPRFSKPFVSGRTITVSSAGKAYAAPDIANVSFGVITQGKDPAALEGDNIKKVNSAIGILENEGVAESDIQTTNYTIYPNYVYNKFSQTQIIESYTFSQSVSVKVRDLSKAAEILGKLSSLGVSQLTGPNFSLSDEAQQKYLIQAEGQAFSNAQEKAQAMAKANGIELGSIINVSESANPYPVYRSMSMGAAVSAPSPIIEPGTNEVDANVSITYEISD